MKNTIHLPNQLQTTLRKILPLILFLSPTQIAGTTHSQKENLTHTLKTLQNQKANKPTERKKGYLRQTTSTARFTGKKTDVQTWDDFTKSQRPVTEKEARALIQKAVKEIRKDTQKQCKQFEIELQKEKQKNTHMLQKMANDFEKWEQDDLRHNKQLAQNNKEIKKIRQNTREMSQQVEEISQSMEKNIQAAERNSQQLADMSASIEQTLQESAQAREENNIQATLPTNSELAPEPITDDNPNTLHPIISEPKVQKEPLPATTTWWEWSKSAAFYTAVIVISSVTTYYLGGQKSPKKPS